MKNLGLRIACLVAAVIIWVQVASTTIIEADVALPLEVANLGTGLTVAGNALPAQAEVRLRASKLRVFAHKYLHRPLGSVQLDLADRQPGPPFLYEIHPRDAHTEQEVVGILAPMRLPIRLDHQLARRLVVQVATSGAVAAGRTLLDQPTAQPDSVTVTGPERFFRGVEEVRTVALSLNQINGRETRMLALVPPHASLVPEVSKVQVSVTVATLEERILANVPVIPLVDAGQADVAVSPPVCDVLVEGPADSVKALVPADLAVTIPLNGLEHGMHNIRGDVDHPAWVTKISLDPATFLVIIGDADAANVSGGKRE